MPAPRRIAALTVALALAAAPGVARAQSGAGDQQYQDPFAGQSQPSKQAAKPAPRQPRPRAAPRSSAPQPQAAPQSSPAQPQAAASPTAIKQLPRTGYDVVPVALLGAVLVAAGLALRRRGAHGRD